MKIPNGIIFIWTGTHATIPAGWSRDTSMDDTYPKGTANAVNPDVTGGATTHSHTSPAHTHTAQSHTHTITLGTGSGGAITGAAGSLAVISAHTHTAATSGAVSGFSCGSTAVTYGSVSNDPNFSTVIYVTPTTFVTFLPAGIVTLADAAITGMDICDGTSGTPNLVDKYLKGASTGADAGTVGGGTTNTHSISHSHTTSHSHLAGTTGSSGATLNATGSGSLVRNHTHDVTPNAATPTATDTLSLVTTETVEPAYKKLLAVRASSDIPAPKSIIGIWKGILSAIPSGWILCDGNGGTIDMRDMHLKITGTVGLVGNAGGSNTHVHGSQNHTHASVSHTHTVPNVTHTSNSNQSGGGANMADNTTIHTASTNAQNLVLDAGSTTADSANNEPPYRTVAFVKLAYRTFPSASILNYL